MEANNCKQRKISLAQNALTVCSLVSALSFGTIGLAQAETLPAPASRTAQGQEGPSSNILRQTQDLGTSDGPVHYKIKLNELPGAQIYEQTGARTDDGRCIFTESGSGRVNGGQGRVLIIKEIFFDPKTCKRNLVRAEYGREEAPISIAKQLKQQELSNTTHCPEDDSEDGRKLDFRNSPQQDCRRLSLVPGKPSIFESDSPNNRGDIGTREGSQLGEDVEYNGSIEVRVEDPLDIDVSSTRSSVIWSDTGSSHTAYWDWYSPTGWRSSNRVWSHDNNGLRAYTDTHGSFSNPVFCRSIVAFLTNPIIALFAPTTRTEHSRTYFEITADGGWRWEYNVRKSGGCHQLLHFDHTVVTP